MDTRRLADQLEHLAQRLRSEGPTTDQRIAEWTAGARSQLAGAGGGGSELTPTEAAALHPASTDRLRTRWTTNLRTLERTTSDTNRILDAARPQRTERTAANGLEATNTTEGYCCACYAAGFNPRGEVLSEHDWHHGTRGSRLIRIILPRQTMNEDTFALLCDPCRKDWQRRVPTSTTFADWHAARTTTLTARGQTKPSSN